MKTYGWIGLLLLAVSEVCLFWKIEPFYSWFYSFAWWSYILLADNSLLALRGRSLLTTRRRELAAMLALSVFAWLIFEACNVVIRNWAYTEVPSNPWIRWPGYALAFATVLPGIFITADLIEGLVFGRGGAAFASESEAACPAPTSAASPVFILAGLVLTAAPLIWPRYFFPAVWIGPILLLDPLVERLGLRSLSISIFGGDRRRVWSLLLSGLACGLLWEFWNFWAGAKWVYTVPFFNRFKLFEMPVLGFLGFPPFALECWLLYHLMSALPRRLGRPSLRVAFWAAIGIFSVLIFHCIDRHTVLRFAGGFARGCEPWFLG